ncbi:hypothetical protein TYRP_015266 [Tyrophagus putrescentiae]|nr:hypothetical protein TYRP_015266 [Tyrophagus putrescentiae]
MCHGNSGIRGGGRDCNASTSTPSSLVKISSEAKVLVSVPLTGDSKRTKGGRYASNFCSYLHCFIFSTRFTLAFIQPKTAIIIKCGHCGLVPETPVSRPYIQSEAPPLEEEEDDGEEVHHQEGGVVHGGAEGIEKTDGHIVVAEVVPGRRRPLVVPVHDEGDEEDAEHADEGDHVEDLVNAQWLNKTTCILPFLKHVFAHLEASKRTVLGWLWLSSLNSRSKMDYSETCAICESIFDRPIPAQHDNASFFQVQLMWRNSRRISLMEVLNRHVVLVFRPFYNNRVGAVKNL